MAAVIGTSYSFTSDEGAAIAQARQISDHGTWIVPHPLPQIDAQNRYYPYVPAEVGTKGVAPFGKHPAYALMLAGLWSVGGIAALVGLSIVGTVVAALAAAALARRMDPSLARPALWAAGIGSPLFFDSYIVVAHTLGAALAGGLVLLLSSRSERPRPWVIAGVCVCAAGVVLMRTEAVFFVAAVALSAMVFRRTRWLGVVTAGAGALAFVGERAWTRSIVGRAVVPMWSIADQTADNAGGARGRLNGAVQTLLRPSFSAGPVAEGLSLLALLGFGVAVLLARRKSALAGPVAAGSAAAVAARLLLAPLDPIPGLLIACPILWVGGWALLTGQRRGEIRPFHVGLVAVFVAAVLATQYEGGGGLEWGGRYFALALPIAIPIALVGLRALPRAFVVSVAVASLALASLGVAELRDTHRATEHLLSSIRVPRGAVAITTASLLPRLDWKAFDDRRWLLVPPGRVEAVLKQLPSAGVRRAVIVYPEDRAPKGWSTRGERIPGFGWRIVSVTVG